jgi:hypothetical protein
MELFILAVLISLLLLLAPLKQNYSDMHDSPPAVRRLVNLDSNSSIVIRGSQDKLQTTLPYYKMRRNYRRKIDQIAAAKSLREAESRPVRRIPASTLEKDNIELIQYEGQRILATNNEGILKLKRLP